MSNLTRRAVLRGSSIAAAAAAVTAIPALVQAAAPADPDAILLRLEAERATVSVALGLKWDAYMKAHLPLPDWAEFPLPRVSDLQRPLFRNWGTWVDQVQLSHIVEHNQAYEQIVEGWRELDASHPSWARLRSEWNARRQEGRQRIAWWHERVTAIKAERVHVDALYAEFETLQGRLLDIDEAIRDTPANGLAGTAVKLRLARTCILESHEGRAVNEGRDVADIADSWEGRIALSALADVERLAGKGGVA